MCLAVNTCNKTINGTVMKMTCPSTINILELNLYDLTTSQLDNITSLVVRGDSVLHGPFTSIPPNICLLRNLQVS